MVSPLPHIATIVLAKKDKAAFQKAQQSLAPKTAITVLGQDKAFDITISENFAATDKPVDLRSIQTDLLARLETQGIMADVCVQAEAGRRKCLLMCDMDSTLIGQECIDELADFAGVKDRVSAITEQAMRGEIGFEGALKARVALLKGLDISVLERCFEERIHLNAGARTLCQTMKALGAKTAIVSGGFTFFTGRIKEACGFDTDQANTLLEDGDTLSGKVGMPILGREAKLEALKAASQDIGGTLNAVAIGDGANDLAMITASGLGIAYRAKPAVAAAAHCAINHSDLTTALYFQGIHEDDFKTD